jgi:hypothetical protein
MPETKRCGGPCKLKLPLDEFYKDSSRKDGKCRWCKSCAKTRSRNSRRTESRRSWERLHYQKNREAILASERERRLANPNMSRNWAYRSLYGISVLQYEFIEARQGFACALCYQPRTAKKRLAVDHIEPDGSKVVRGLLCDPCNTALERLDTVEDWATKAEAYRANPPAQIHLAQFSPDRSIT